MKNHLHTLALSSTNNRSGSCQRRLIIVARSANLLAQAAKSGGYQCAVIDAYGDKDTQLAAHDWRRLKYTGERIDFQSLNEIISELKSLYGESPILWGGGWESSGHILCALAANHEVLGSHPRALLRLSSPNWFKHLHTVKRNASNNGEIAGEAEESVHYYAPAIFVSNCSERTLIKSRQRSGGHAVREASGERFLPSSEYFQPLLVGRSISALCLADGHHVKIIGWSEHFKLQHNGHWHYRHSAAVTIAPLNPPAALIESLQCAMKYLGLFGIFGCDFIQSTNGQLKLVDINPRVTATAPLHIARDKILRLHLSPNSDVEKRFTAAASAVIYADIPIRIAKTIDWPPWASDLPAEERVYHSAEPLCTIHSCAENTKTAKCLLVERFNELMARLQ